MRHHSSYSFFFFTDPATTEIYTLSLHDALPICLQRCAEGLAGLRRCSRHHCRSRRSVTKPTSSSSFSSDRKSTRLNSSHTVISYAVFCLKKKKKQTIPTDFPCSRDAFRVVPDPL